MALPSSLIHHHVRRLVEAHVAVADQPLGLIRKHFVVAAVVEEGDALLRQPLGEVGNARHLRNVVAVLLACKNCSRSTWIQRRVE